MLISIADVVLDHMIASCQLEELHRQRVLETLLLKHRHYGDHHHHHHHHKGLLQAIKGSFHRHLDELDQGTPRTGSHSSLTGLQGDVSADSDKGDGPARNTSAASGLGYQHKVGSCWGWSKEGFWAACLSCAVGL